MAADSSVDCLAAIEALRKLQPKSIRAHLADGRTEQIAVPTTRKKWAHVSVTLTKLRWLSLEALDAQGGILGVVENDTPAGALEDLEGETAGKVGETRAMLQLFLRAQDVALARQEKIINTTLSMNARLCETLMSRLNALEKAHHAHLDRIEQLREALTEADDGDEPGAMSGELLRELLPAIRKRKANGKGDALED